MLLVASRRCTERRLIIEREIYAMKRLYRIIFVPNTHFSRVHHCLHSRVSPVDRFLRRTWRGCRGSHRPRGLLWQNACGQLWSFLAYDLVLIVPFLLRSATVSSAQLPSLIVNTLILVYSAALALYYLLIKQETRFRLSRARLSSQAKPLEWSR